MDTLLKPTGSSGAAIGLLFLIAIILALAVHELAVVILRRALREGGPGRKIIDRGSGMTRLAALLLGIAVVLPAAKFDPALSAASSIAPWMNGKLSAKGCRLDG